MLPEQRKNAHNLCSVRRSLQRPHHDHHHQCENHLSSLEQNGPNSQRDPTDRGTNEQQTEECVYDSFDKQTEPEIPPSPISSKYLAMNVRPVLGRKGKVAVRTKTQPEPQRICVFILFYNFIRLGLSGMSLNTEAHHARVRVFIRDPKQHTDCWH